MKTLFGTILMASLLFAAATQAGTTISQSRDVAGFQGLELHGRLEVTVEQGDTFVLTLEGDSVAVGATKSQVREGRLVVEGPGGFSLKGPVRALITLPELESVAAGDAVRAQLRGFAGPGLRLDLSGAASIAAWGRYGSYELSAGGASSAQLEGLEARVGTLHLDGAARAVLAPADQLRGTLSGAARVRYLGLRETSIVDTGDAARIDYGSSP